LETTYEMPFELFEQDYAPYREYDGTFDFPNHAFSKIGEMGKKEEPRCAKKIDDHPNVKRWIRNLTHERAGGFSLPLSPGRFFPDFIVELKDGRVAIVEYKGDLIVENPKEKHKRDVGELWAKRSNGQGVFVSVENQDWAKLEAALNAVS
jgi:type III restriction enzyme